MKATTACGSSQSLSWEKFGLSLSLSGISVTNASQDEPLLELGTFPYLTMGNRYLKLVVPYAQSACAYPAKLLDCLQPGSLMTCTGTRLAIYPTRLDTCMPYPARWGLFEHSGIRLSSLHAASYNLVRPRKRPCNHRGCPAYTTFLHDW